MRFQPRFSVRTLTIFVTILCAYLGAWEATKKFGGPSHRELLMLDRISVSYPVPFLIVQDESDPEVRRDYGKNRLPYVRRFYLWFFVVRVRLPLETNCPNSSQICAIRSVRASSNPIGEQNVRKGPRSGVIRRPQMWYNPPTIRLLRFFAWWYQWR